MNPERWQASFGLRSISYTVTVIWGRAGDRMRRSAFGLLTMAALACGASPVRSSPPYPVTDQVLSAEHALQRKNYAQALKRVERALAENPKDPVALATRGNTYIGMGDYPHAMADHDAVLKLAPRAPGAWMNACWVRALANIDLDAAMTDCDLAVRGSTESGFAARDTRGFLHYRRREFELAVADYDAALKQHPNLASALYGRGLSKLRLGKTDEGRTDLAAASKIEPGIADTYARRGAVP